MLNRLSCALLFVFLPLFCTAEDQHLLKSRMMGDLDVIKNTFEVKYAPAEWKKQYANWDLDERINGAKAEISSRDKITVKEYQKILRGFFNSTRDYHVGVTFHSTCRARLPFRVQGAQDRYFVVWTDRHEASMPLSIGDEILFFDHQPISAVINDLRKKEIGEGTSSTDQGRAELYLTNRLGDFGMEVPNGKVRITVRHFKSNKVADYDLNWEYAPEEVNNANVYRASGKMAAKAQKQENPFQNKFFHKPMTAGFYPTWHKGVEMREADPLGARKSFIPVLGQVIWKSAEDSTFHAYLFKTPDQKTIGYIRIPNYMGGELAALDFMSAIDLFQKKSDALVIDQVDNPGGEVFYMYALIAMLTDRPLALPTHRETITQEDVIFSLDALRQFKSYDQKSGGPADNRNSTENISGYPVSEKLVADLTQNFTFIIKEWNEGRSFTTPHYLYGIQEIQPHREVRYTKPILVLVNEMAFSCGDFFPAIMQDNKRATIFGARTAGAGGFVLEHNHPNKFGVAGYTFTSSLAERSDHKPIENLGVTPDIQYELTPADLQDGYNDYVKAVQAAIKKLF